ncbi:MAG: hypothetical protein L3J34_12150 [Flavobacteriaceae bacterium]|nr:hypothetical protein [Flavobacteriaceae bacterium]
MKLSTKNIDQLYKFTRIHFVEWHDLQTELVDHLANDIEQIWKEEPNLSFDQAKTKAFKRFGVFGFSDVIADKTNAVHKQYWRVFWNIFKDYFKLPKLLLILLTTLIIFTIVDLMENKITFLIITFWIIFTVPIIFFFKYNIALKRKFKESGKKWMVDEIIRQSGLIFFIGIQIPIQLLRYVNKDLFVLNTSWLLIASFFLSVFATFVYIVIKIMPPKLEEEMSKLYPEYNLYKKA